MIYSNNMKTTILIATLALVISAPLASSAMTVGDVEKLYQEYKTTPKVLGATSDVAGPTLTPESVTLIKGLKYASKSSVIVSKVKPGMVKNGEVKKLQLFLSATGDFNVTPNGTYGPATKAAVKAFQIKNGLKGDGVFGPMTRDAITTKVEEASAQ